MASSAKSEAGVRAKQERMSSVTKRLLTGQVRSEKRRRPQTWPLAETPVEITVGGSVQRGLIRFRTRRF